MIQFGMPTLIENRTLEENIALCRSLGLRFIELNMNFPEYQTDRLDQTDVLLRLAEEAGIYYTIHLDENLNIADFNELVTGAYLETVRRSILTAKKLLCLRDRYGDPGQPLTLNMHMNHGIYITLPDRKVQMYERDFDVYIKSFAAFRSLCEEWIGDSGVMIAVENTDGFRDYEKKAIEYLLESPKFGLTWDIGHSKAIREKDVPFILEHKDRLIHFHIHDGTEAPPRNHLALGDGEIDLDERLELAGSRNARCVLETKTIEALKKSVEWLSGKGYRCGGLTAPEGSLTVCGIPYKPIRLLGRGKGGYSYLAEHAGRLFVLKQIHHEPCDYYTFGNKIEAEINDYRRLKNAGIRIPEMIAADIENERIIKEYIEGDTISDIIKRGDSVEEYLGQVREMAAQAKAASLNIDYYPTNFVVRNGLLWYIDYECNDYMDEWSFENWGIKHWVRTLEYHQTTEEEKAAICEWKYDGEYAVYNNLPYEEQIRTQRGFANPRNNFYSFCEGERLIGYINLVEKASEVFLGIGVSPEYCGRGYGPEICRGAVSLSRRLYPGKPVCLEVRTWNERAVRCYEKAGFRIVGEPVVKTTPAGEGTFYFMTTDLQEAGN